ncbi:MAG: type II secretion system protein [Synergistaceae bacterium]|nr:type II secretion system protein [Synergistaceae bacterium]
MNLRKARKGLTLLELLIVIAIVGALAATMSVSITKSNPRAKAKAAAIVSNVNACRAAASLYYMELFDSSDAGAAAENVTAFLPTTGDNEYVPAWSDFRSGAITYSAEGATPDVWTITVDFSKDSDKENIETAIKAIKGYSKIGTKKAFEVTLLSGKVKDAEPAGGGGD